MGITSHPEPELPLTQAAHQKGMSRERLLRRVLAGQVEGRLIAGRWLVNVASLHSALPERAERPSAPIAAA